MTAYRSTTCRPGRAFTLIELLVVISLIGLLVSILLPALAKARDSARGIRCAAQLKQIGLGAMTYLEDNRQRFHSRYFANATRNTEAINPGIAEYVGVAALGIRDTIFTCPTLQTLFPTQHWNRNLTYTSNQYNNYNYSYSHVKLNNIVKPSRASYIFDGSTTFSPGQSWFYTNVTRGGSSTLADLKYPHADANNTLFVDGHAAPQRYEAFNVSMTQAFWSGK
jgi:prepilin-type N-terminal cleavage/methylation domain-containing protein/prepilin-type processing-associated H-X9-DG protein